MSASAPLAEPTERAYDDALLGKILHGKYRIVASVAAGGMGKIYRAEQIPLGRPVALKVLHARHAAASDGPALQKRFLREASILSKLQHPNIVTVFDYGTVEAEGDEPPRVFMAMEYLSGETLLQRLLERGRLPWKQMVGIGRQIARGLREAHAHGIVHRDLKPSNVMLLGAADGEERVKIVDFGIVKVLALEGGGDTELTQEGCLVGSPNYMAPEQISTGKVDGRADAYSLGVILYQCLTGLFPFEASTAMQMMVAHVNKPVIPIRVRAPGVEVPEWLVALIGRLLEKSADKRPASMDDVLRALSDGGAKGPLDSASRTSSPAPTPIPSSLSQPSVLPRARRGPPFVIAGVVASASALAMFLLVGKPLPVAPDTFQLEIRSEPSGADVLEDGVSLGATPLVLSLDNQRLRATPRALTVTKPGLEPYAVVQGPSDHDVAVLARLVAPAEVVATAPPPATTSAPLLDPVADAGAPSTSPRPTAGRPRLDIQLSR